MIKFSEVQDNGDGSGKGVVLLKCQQRHKMMVDVAKL